jgi:hypothetical protein
VGEGGSVDDRTVGEVAACVRRLLAAIHAGELTCPPTSRHRLEGAVVALEALAACPETIVSAHLGVADPRTAESTAPPAKPAAHHGL